MTKRFYLIIIVMIMTIRREKKNFLMEFLNEYSKILEQDYVF